MILLWIWCLDRKYKIVIVFFYQKHSLSIIENFCLRNSIIMWCLQTLTTLTILSKRMDSSNLKWKSSSQLTGHEEKITYKLPILLQNNTILLKFFPFNKTRRLFSGWCWCGLCWMIDMTDELFTGESISRIIVLPCFCAKDIIKLYGPRRPDKNFRIYGNLILYLMRYTFRIVYLFLASAGQNYYTGDKFDIKIIVW